MITLGGSFHKKNFFVESKYTLAAGLNALQATEMTGSWPVFAAAAITVSLPVLVIFFLCQKYMTSGLTAGGVKG